MDAWIIYDAIGKALGEQLHMDITLERVYKPEAEEGEIDGRLEADKESGRYND